MKTTIKVAVTFDIIVKGLSDEDALIFRKEDFIEYLESSLEESGAENIKIKVGKPIVEEEY